MVNESLGSCGKPQPPPKNDSPQKWCGWDPPRSLFPPVDMSFLGRGQKDDAQRQEASEEIGGGSQSPNAGHRSMQGIAFFGTRPPKNGRGAICRTIWTLHPSEIERPYVTYFFLISFIFFSTLQYGWLPGASIFFPPRTSSCKKYPSLAQGDSILRTVTAFMVDSEMNRYLTHGFNRVYSVYAEMGKGFNPV